MPRQTAVSSGELFKRASRVIPGGVNSPVRACSAVGTEPLFITRGRGSKIWDAEGRPYIDYVCSWGPLILGHAPPEVVRAVSEAAGRGTSFGAPTEAEIELAELIAACLPSVEMVRLVNSGTEAAMTAIRLARGITGRPYVIKFSGCYHGHVDSLLVAAGSGVATLGLPGSPGVPEDLASLTISLPYNDLEPVGQAFDRYKDRIAAVIVEPVAGNMGMVPPADGFLPDLADLARRHGALFILDEVITGFRLGLGGAQGLFHLDPDLTCLGKIIGGGLPVGAVGGKRDLMLGLAPVGTIYQAGTLSGNPLAVAAGLTTIRTLQKNPSVYDQLQSLSLALADGLAAQAEKAGFPATGHQLGSMSCLFFNPGPVRNYADAARSDTDLFAAFYRKMRARGIYLAPSQFETTFVSAAHDREDIKATLEASAEVFEELARERNK